MSAVRLPRSPGNLLAVVHARHVEDNPAYQPGDGYTHCNQFVRDILADLGVPLPSPHLFANEQIDWLDSPKGRASGWRECILSRDAAAHANVGQPCVATYRNPVLPPAGHSHIAVVVPAVGGVGPNIAQAGYSCFSNKPVARGFGTHHVRYFFNPQ